MDAGIVVVCAGGGGVPVATAPGGAASGMEAVIDKDLAAALLAHELGADALLMLTDVDAAYSAWGTNFKQPIREIMPEQLRKMSFAPGSMKPKVEAACRFVEGGGSFAGIGLLEDAAAILEGKRGTVVRPAGVSLDFVKRAKSAERTPPPARPRTPTISRAAPQRPAQKAPRPAPAPPPAAAPRPPSKPRPDAAPEPWVPFHIRSIPAPSAPSPEPTTRSRRKSK